MIVKVITANPYLGKGKVWMKFIDENGNEMEKYFNVRIQKVSGHYEFTYQVDDDFPPEMLKLIFGYGAVVLDSRETRTDIIPEKVKLLV